MLMELLTKTILCFCTTLLNQSKNPEFPHENCELFNFDALDPVECVADFRVEKQDIPRLADALGIPPVIKCQQRSVCDGTEGLVCFCVVLLIPASVI